MLPWPVWPLAGQSGLGQNTVARSMSILLALSSGLPRVWLDLRFCYKSASPRFSAELPYIADRSDIPEKSRLQFFIDVMHNDTNLKAVAYAGQGFSKIAHLNVQTLAL